MRDAIDRLAELLPAQGPISIFIHHNTLHAFEEQPFEVAIEQAAERFGREPYLWEARYRAKLDAGRIRAGDIESVLVEELGARAHDQIGRLGTRLEFWRRVVLHGIPAAGGHELSWLLEESAALAKFRTDRRLWVACLAAVGRATAPRTPASPPLVRHRDLIKQVSGVDTDEWIHAPLIRFIAGYLDQGLAQWAMPDRDEGIYGCFVGLYGTSLAAHCGPWARDLSLLIADDRRAGRDTLASLEHSLGELGVARDEWTPYLTGTLLALRGWAGMVRQIEERPDRVPAREVPATLAGYLAVRLLFERAAIAYAAGHVAFEGPVSELRAFLRTRVPAPESPTLQERAWPLFHLTQLFDVDASIVEHWTATNVEEIESELRGLSDLQRRRVLHLAYERGLRHRLYDALTSHAPRQPPVVPVFQAVFCIDEREESFRRHLEEVEPGAETLSTPGFFGVAMYHQGVADAHPRPLCPVVIRPEHYVAEVDQDPGAFAGRSLRAQRRAAGFLGYNVHIGSRTLVRGAVVMTLLGWLMLVPLVLRVVFPWLASRWRGVLHDSSAAAARTRLRLARDDTPPPVGVHSGFTIPEMAGIVRRVLEDIGIAARPSRLILVVGHGSISLNNPHESAHDCGACGGGRGGPNARAFAQMANDPLVRHRLAADGLVIPTSTWFVGAERNTCNNHVTFFDDDLVPAELQDVFTRATEAFDAARRQEAHERCRRFDAVPSWYPPLAALAHVEGRAADLAQPRPEYGHATNAYCVIGRRARTTGLFLDRRAFLVSYDPTQDEDAAVLSRLLAAVVPVVAGISLEYYFSYVDPTGYGCGTKLPHNVTSLLGVMDGAQSDLRTGLPWQMVEIHEAVRLAIVVEGDRDRIWRAVEANPSVERLVRNRWVWLAALDPQSGALSEFAHGAFVAHSPHDPAFVVVDDSATWYSGKRGFLAPAVIAPRHSGLAARPPA